ncbi:MAG: hypothetical protein HOI95_24735 [Chromatiales bacterium]|nr:hypothetical protein [Chromatiales bacterium]
MSQPLSFPANDDGLRSFAQYLLGAPGIPSYLLVDLVEEEFREETVPHVFGSDRRALLRNRQSRLFRDSRYSGAIIQGRETTGRRDDVVLFTALIRPELLAPWLSQITKAKVPLGGIYSVPVLSPTILSTLKLETSEVLLVTLQESGGLRQSYIRNGQLKVSRLAMAPRLDPGQHARYILSEIATLRRYLNSLRMFETGASMDVVILAGRSLLKDLQREAGESVDVHLHVLDLNDVGNGHGLRTPINSSYADALFAHILARGTPSNYYGRPEDTRYITHHRARTLMSAASVVMLLGSITYSGFQLIGSVLIHREAQIIAQQAGFYEARYERGKEALGEVYQKAGLPATDAQPLELKQAVELVEAVADYKADPWPLMLVVSGGLNLFESLRIERIDWGVSTDPDAEVSDNGGIVPSTNDFRTTSAAVSRKHGEYFQLAHVKGRIDPFSGDYRDALERVNRFVNELGELEAVHDVQLTELPFDASSRRRVTGSAVTAGTVEEARFELRLVVKVAAEPEAEPTEVRNAAG